MSNKDNYERSAAEFIKQWQAQMTRQMHNPDMIRAMLDALQQFGVKPNDEAARKPSAAPDARDDAIRQLAGRVDTLEQQLAILARRLVSLDAKTKNATRTKHRHGVRDDAANERKLGRAKPVVAKASKRTSKAKPKRK